MRRFAFDIDGVLFVAGTWLLTDSAAAFEISEGSGGTTQENACASFLLARNVQTEFATGVDRILGAGVAQKRLPCRM